MTTTSRAHSFNAAAAQYAANRPSYPPELFDVLVELGGRPLDGARVVDVGAGTGISTALLAARGAQVVAVEPGEGMAAQFRRTLPGVSLVRGDGNALPFAGEAADYITYAQSWHWTDPRRSAPEALRVLRPGGTLALWWNVPDHRVPWIAAQDARIRGWSGAETGAHGTPDRLRDMLTELSFTQRRVRWSRHIPIDTHLANLGSHSVFLVLGEEGTGKFLAAEREHLREVFPHGTVEEVYAVDLLAATRPASRP